mmetsp:Transcript_23027/g.27248  ORF Transcript_23027/g.27248 Transcript_23027/m.27248 type:complete len:717 (-) Transcript_23027:515-2665(-)
MSDASISSRTTSELEKEKNALQQQIEELRQTLSELTDNGVQQAEGHDLNQNPINAHSKSGYLSKWQDRAIGWGGTKWDLRFVRLEQGRLCYYRSHEDAAPRYMLTLKRCAVRDDGHKPNKRFRKNQSSDIVPLQTCNAFFHIFSIYVRPNGNEQNADDDNDEEIVPLLRFSTMSYAEKNQWIELISEACAYCNTDEFAQNENDNFSFERTPRSAKKLKGTLPMMHFDSGDDSIRSVPSFRELKVSYLKTNSSKDASTSNSKQKSGYPPSKPMHRCTEPSYLSNEAPVQNYRGFLNLGFIIFIISNLRLLMGTIQEYGFVIARGGGVVSALSFVDLPFISGLGLLNVFISQAYLIELNSSRGLLRERLSTSLHLVNANLALFVSIAIVWCLIDSPIGGCMLLMCAVTTWMKLLSYMHANTDYRNHPNRASLKVIDSLDQDSLDIVYPENVTLSNIYYFCFAPTLTYQIAFPRMPCRRWFRIATLTGRLVLSISAMYFLLNQVISPPLGEMIKELEAHDQKYAMFSFEIMTKYLPKLTIACTYTWLLVFYAYFHLFFNLLAEILKFGDRVFYKDWWNSSNVSSYWRLWNLPVHYWLIRHVYFPCIRKGVTKGNAMFIVFFISAVLHEVMISIPFHMIRPWCFLGMMGQIPLVAVTKYFDKIWPGSSIGNVIFWFSFCVIGQPTAILMYTIDYWKMESERNSDTMDLNSTLFESTREEL